MKGLLHYVKFITLSLFLTATFMTPFATLAAEKDTITLFLPNTDWPPYLLHTDNGPRGGLFVEVLEEAAKLLGYEISVKFLPDKRGWMLLDAGEIDAHVKAKEWVLNPDKYYWTDSFMLSEDVLLYPRESQLQYTSPEALYGKQIAAVTNFVYPALEPHFGPEKIIRVDVPYPCTMLDLLDCHRVDAAIVNRAETQWLMRVRPDLRLERFRMDETPFESAGYRYLFTRKKDWEPFVQDFNDALKKMKQDGWLKALINKYR